MVNTLKFEKIKDISNANFTNPKDPENSTTI